MSKTTNKKLTVDFTGVEARKMVPEGDHRMRAVEATLEDGNEHPYVAWVLEVQAGAGKGGKLYDNTSLAPKALWRLRTLLEAMGIEVPEGKMPLDLAAWVKEGGEFLGTVEHEKYEGKTKARLVDVFAADADGDDDEEDVEEEKPKVGKKKADADEKPSGKEEPEEDENEAPDFDEMDTDELEEFVDEHDLDVDLDDHKKLSKKRAAVKEAFEAKSAGGDDEDKDEDAEDKYEESAIQEMGTKDLQAIITKHKLGIELDGSTKTKRRAVLKALKAKSLIAA